MSTRQAQAVHALRAVRLPRLLSGALDDSQMRLYEQAG